MNSLYSDLCSFAKKTPVILSSLAKSFESLYLSIFFGEMVLWKCVHHDYDYDDDDDVNQ